MNNKLSLSRSLISGFSATAIYLASSSSLFAAEEAPASDPVWVISYFTFIVFAGAVIMLALVFSRNRRDTLLDMAEQKRVAEIRAERTVKRRKEQQRAKMEAAKAAKKKR